MRKAENYFLTALSCIALLVYYVAASHHEAMPDLRQMWVRSKISVQRGSARSQLFESWTSRSSDEIVNQSSFTIFNTKWLGMPGHVLNFWQDITPDWLVLGQKQANRWYFYRNEPSLQRRQGVTMVQLQYGAEQRHFVSELRAQGITTVIVPVPTKGLIMQEYIPSKWRQAIEDPGLVYRELVRPDPLWTVDLYSAFKDRYQNHPNELLYRPLDSHWTSLGSVVAVQETIKLLIERNWRVRMPLPKYLKTLPNGDPNVFYNSLYFLFLPDFFVRSRLDLQWNERLYDIDHGLPKREGRLFVFGTSYSRQLDGLGVSYSQMLARALGLDLHDYSKGGSDFVEGLRSAKESNVKFRKGDLVVIEFPLNKVQVWQKKVVLPDIEGMPSPRL